MSLADLDHVLDELVAHRRIRHPRPRRGERRPDLELGWSRRRPLIAMGPEPMRSVRGVQAPSPGLLERM